MKEIINNEYTGGREMMVTDLPQFFSRPVTIADLTPGTQEYEAREALRRNIEEQYLWELEREELRQFKKGVFEAGKAIAIGGLLITVVVVAVIAVGYYAGV